jgi:thiol-disulfide isomerase/thioredoxin
VSRFDAVKTSAPAGDAARWCDAYFPAGGPRLALPKLTAARPGDPVPSLPAGRPAWVNVWATWCVPCQQEMPLLVRWREALRREGREVELVFLSVDEKESELTDFLRTHPDIAPGPSGRFVTPADLDPWLAKLIQPVPAGIPVNVLAGADGTVRCVRAGSLHDGDYALVSAILR